ncbi:MAG: hydrolase [Caldithrix sp.]|nr:hydrolase [Caldithrix sp.]
MLVTLPLISAENDEKTLFLVKTEKSINVDGYIESTWNQADSVSDFVQQSPYHGEEPSYRTVAKVITTPSRMYCLIKCYQDRSSIQQMTGKLDDASGDNVSIMLDTFGNGRTAYKFSVTATGVKSDCRMLDDARNRDYSWDGIWFSGTQIYDWGYAVEIEIPYKSIQYDEELSAWGLDFDRWLAVKTEDIYWCAYEESEGQRISKFGKLIFEDFIPTMKGMHLEFYPVGIARADYIRDSKYDLDPDLGIDVFYNPSPRLTFQLTANPDFAQIEADPFEFNISRYETYYDERRPFFTEGSEIFMPAGKQRNSGFYSPLELFYSRRIGKKLPDGDEVPLLVGTKAFGRVNQWEYGGFLAATGETDYKVNGEQVTEPQSYFASVRLKKQILENSSLGVLYVGKHNERHNTGVVDIDGAFRGANWQLAYQMARSYKDNEGDYGGSAGFTSFGSNWLAFMRGRYIGNNFDVNEVGFVPWKGTGEFVGLAGPRWYFQKGYIRQILMYVGPTLNYEKVDQFTDYGGLVGFNMQFRNNWGFEINVSASDSKDNGERFTSYNTSISSWYNISPKWDGGLYGGFSRTYNFDRDFLAFYSWWSGDIAWQAANTLEIGTSASAFIEGNPDGQIEDITYNTRPFFSATPVNNLNIRVYVDNVFVRSKDQFTRLISGLLFSYNFAPKSWIYLALNEVQDRSTRYGQTGNRLPSKMHVVDRAGVFKVKYLYYF